jgi:hypothetical protein
VNDVGPDTAPSQSTQGHNYTDTPAETVTAVLAAGMDSDCHGSMQQGTVYMTPQLMRCGGVCCVILCGGRCD